MEQLGLQAIEQVFGPSTASLRRSIQAGMHEDHARQIGPSGILTAGLSAVRATYGDATGEVLPEAVLAGLRGQLDQIRRLADLIPETLREPTRLTSV